MTRRPPTSTPFPSTTLFRSHTSEPQSHDNLVCRLLDFRRVLDRKSTRLNSSHTIISYAVFCLKKKRWTASVGLGRRRTPRGWGVARAPRAPAPAAVQPCLAGAPGVLVEVGGLLVFFLNAAAPPGVLLFPLPAPFPI